MASTFSPNLRLELIGTGEQQGTWGATTNTNLGTLLEEAIGGYVSVTVSDVGDTTLTTVNGGADQSRNMVINLTGTISAARNIICPAIEKLYVVKNSTVGGFSVTFKVSGQPGVVIPNGDVYFLYVDGSDATKIVGSTASTNVTNTFTATQIISVTDNTNAALRITQLGTADVIRVEDSANPDATPFVVSSGGLVGVRTSTPEYNFDVTADDNVITTTAVAIQNSSRNYGLGLGAYQLTNRNIGGIATNIDYTFDIGGDAIFKTNNTERLRVSSTGAFGLSGANYGTSNQVLTSAGSSAAPVWQNKVTVSSTTSTTSPWAWNSDGFDQFAFTALANNLTINADAGNPTNGQRVVFRFKPNTNVTLTWTTGTAKSFRSIGTTLPTSILNGKTTYVGCIYNSADSRWDAVAVTTEV